MKKTFLLILASLLTLASCNLTGGGRPHINGSERQPLMHGWTYEQAGEFWLGSTLDDELSGVQPLTAEQLATLSDENIQVRLPLAPDGTDPAPRSGRTYRQAGTGGSVTFRQQGDTLKATLDLREPNYFPQDSAFQCYVRRHGRGIYTLYYITDRGTRRFPDGRRQPVAAVIAIHPGADSLTICRGNMLGPDYVAE